MSDEPYLVFISHASSDRWVAKQMAAILERKGRRYGIETFLDEKDVAGGDSIPEEIQRGLQACTELVVLVSAHSLARQWVLVELGGAWTLGRRIIAIRDKVPPEDLPDIIRFGKAYDLNDFDAYVEEVVGRARGRREGK